MSLNALSTRTGRLWPLWLMSGLMLLAGFTLWQYWPTLLLQSVMWQKTLNREMSQLLQQVAAQPDRAGAMLLLFSVAYGVLHALGPGHGKMVITTFLATHPAKLRTSIKLTLLAALLQGGVAIALVTVMLVVLQTSSRQLHLGSYWLEKGSYLLVIALGIGVSGRALHALRQRWQAKPALRFQAFRPAHHQHDAHCGCGHAHLPSAAQLQRAVSGKTQALVVLSMGLRPCSGAIMMLLFARVIDVYRWGVASAVAMAMGTALTVTLIGVVVARCRAFAQRLSRASAQPRTLQWAMPLLALLGGVILMVTGLLLWQSAAEIVGGIARPFL